MAPHGLGWDCLKKQHFKIHQNMVDFDMVKTHDTQWFMQGLSEVTALQNAPTLLLCLLCLFPLTRFNQYYNEAVSQVKHSTDLSIKRLLTELETGGNVRFEDGNSNDVW